jgi:hypothetical protein
MLVTIGFTNLSIIIVISIVLIGISMGGKKFNMFKMFSFLNPFGSIGKVTGLFKKKK